MTSTQHKILSSFIAQLMKSGDMEYVTGRESRTKRSGDDVPFPSCIADDLAAHPKTADLLRHFMSTSPRLQAIPGSHTPIDPTFEELCTIDWALNAMSTTQDKLATLRRKGIAAIVSCPEVLALQDVAERADEIELAIDHAITLSKWTGMCLARRSQLLALMC